MLHNFVLLLLFSIANTIKIFIIAYSLIPLPALNSNHDGNNAGDVVDKVHILQKLFAAVISGCCGKLEALSKLFNKAIENRDKDKLEFHQIAKVTKVALRSGDKIWGQETTDFTIDVIESFGNFVVRIEVISGLGTDPALHSLGLSLIGNELGADILVAEIKEPIVVDGNKQSRVSNGFNKK